MIRKLILLGTIFCSLNLNGMEKFIKKGTKVLYKQFGVCAAEVLVDSLMHVGIKKAVKNNKTPTIFIAGALTGLAIKNVVDKYATQENFDVLKNQISTSAQKNLNVLKNQVSTQKNNLVSTIEQSFKSKPFQYSALLFWG